MRIGSTFHALLCDLFVLRMYGTLDVVLYAILLQREVVGFRTVSFACTLAKTMTDGRVHLQGFYRPFVFPSVFLPWTVTNGDMMTLWWSYRVV